MSAHVRLIDKAIFPPPSWYLFLPPTLFISPTSSPHCVGDQERLVNPQHQHHEGRFQGVLVCPDCWIAVLVQRWGGERNFCSSTVFTGHTGMWLAKKRWHCTTGMCKNEDTVFGTVGINYPKWRFGDPQLLEVCASQPSLTNVQTTVQL